MEVPEVCAVCNQPIGTLYKVTLGDKGCSSINKASKERGDIVHCISRQLIHQEYHCKYCKPDQIAKTLREGVQAVTVTATNTGKHILWSAQKQFNFHTDCYFCGEPAIVDKKRKSSEDVSTAKTLETRNTILVVCHDR